jgi:hypothetical protein
MYSRQNTQVHNITCWSIFLLCFMTLGQMFFELCATPVENCKFLLSQGQKLQKILNIHKRYPGAQLHMLINILVKFHDSRSNTFWATCDTKVNGRTINQNPPPPPKVGHKNSLYMFIKHIIREYMKNLSPVIMGGHCNKK